MVQNVTVVFDIGKTNKKFFVFDEAFNELEREYIRFEEIPDDDGFAGEDLDKLVAWIFASFDKLLANDKYRIVNLNFSTYGASLVHLDQAGNRVTPFYNYLKPLPAEVEASFLSVMEREHFELQTASPFMGMLNSGLQLYYLKQNKPELFSKVRHSLHLPQYLSYLFTGKHVTDYTSLGCHTGLWDFQSQVYAQWVADAGLEPLLAPVVSSTQAYSIERRGQDIRVGVGVHDSSSALVPYINATDEPFVLISTGTWSICMNFFNEEPLTRAELAADCLNFMSIKGSSIKASRLFLGKHLSEQARILSEYYGVEYESYKYLKWKSGFVSRRPSREVLLFNHELLRPERFGYVNPARVDYSFFESYEDALWHFFDELTDLQLASLRLAIGSSDVKKIYIDGGFSSSEVFVQMMANKLPDYEVSSTSFALGTALGAALLVNYRSLPASFFKSGYSVKTHALKR